MVGGGALDLCNFGPGFEVDLMVTGSLHSMTSVWMGLSGLRQEIDSGRQELDGNDSTFAPLARKVS